MVFIFGALNKTLIYKMPYRDRAHDKLELVMSFNYMNSFRPKKNKEYYHMRIPNDENLLFQVKENEYVYVGDKVNRFETNGKKNEIFFRP